MGSKEGGGGRIETLGSKDMVAQKTRAETKKNNVGNWVVLKQGGRRRKRGLKREDLII